MPPASIHRFKNIDMIAVQEQMVRAGNARRPCANYGDPHRGGKVLGDKVPAETQSVRARLVVRDITFERFDPNRFVDQVTPACHLAEPHANASASRGHRIFLQNDAERMLRLSIADVVDVLRDIDF